MAKAAVVTLLLCSLVVACGGGGPATAPVATVGSSGLPSTPAGSNPQHQSTPVPVQPSSSVASPSGSGAIAAGAWKAGDGQAGAGSTLLGCATPSFCIAGGYVWNGSSWSPMAAQPDTGSPNILDCRSATDCSAISDDQYTAWNGSAWQTSKNFFQDGGKQGGVSIDSMSCPSATFCAAADQSYGYVYLFDGKTWTTDKAIVDQAVADATAAVNAGGTGSIVFNTIACASASFCALVDGAGNARTFDGKTWSASVSVSSKTTQDNPTLECPDPSFCLASVGGTASVWNGSAWQPGTDVPAFDAASCATASLCMLVGVHTLSSDWATFDGHAVAIGSGQTGIQQPWAVSCPTTDFCLATGPYGYATWTAD